MKIKVRYDTWTNCIYDRTVIDTSISAYETLCPPSKVSEQAIIHHQYPPLISVLRCRWSTSVFETSKFGCAIAGWIAKGLPCIVGILVAAVWTQTLRIWWTSPLLFITLEQPFSTANAWALRAARARRAYAQNENAGRVLVSEESLYRSFLARTPTIYAS